MKKIMVGGQAVIEGVMMRSPNYFAVSVRNERGKIKTMSGKIKAKSRFLRAPFIRGGVNLVEMLVLGIRTLLWSADQQTDKKEENILEKEEKILEEIDGKL